METPVPLGAKQNDQHICGLEQKRKELVDIMGLMQPLIINNARIAVILGRSTIEAVMMMSRLFW